VTVRAGNEAVYDRDAKATLIEKWLRARGFIVQ
jgi:hypothetical protein